MSVVWHKSDVKERQALKPYGFGVVGTDSAVPLVALERGSESGFNDSREVDIQKTRTAFRQFEFRYDIMIRHGVNDCKRDSKMFERPLAEAHSMRSLLSV